MDGVINFVTNVLPTYLSFALMIIGGLKVMARYTPWSWDEQVLDLIEKPISFVYNAFFGKKPEPPKES